MIPDPSEVSTNIDKSPCQSIGLSTWINRYVAAPGYHVVCLTKLQQPFSDGSWRISIEGWRNGHHVVNQKSGQTFTGSRSTSSHLPSYFIFSYSDLRRHIESILSIDKIHTDSYLDHMKSRILDVKSSNQISGTTNAWEYLPQPWGLFTTFEDSLSISD